MQAKLKDLIGREQAEYRRIVVLPEGQKLLRSLREEEVRQRGPVHPNDLKPRTARTQGRRPMRCPIGGRQTPLLGQSRHDHQRVGCREREWKFGRCLVIPKGLPTSPSPSMANDSFQQVMTRRSKVWDLAANKAIRTLEKQGAVSFLALSRDGKRLCVAEDDEIKVWDPETGKEICTLQGHTKPITGLAFVGDGKRLFSVSKYRTLCEWNLEAPKEIKIRRKEKAEILGLALSANGKRSVLRASWTAWSVTVLDPDTDKEVRTLHYLLHPSGDWRFRLTARCWLADCTKFKSGTSRRGRKE